MVLTLFYIFAVWVVFSVVYGADTDYGQPLILTPYLDAGKIDEAQKLCKVTPDIGNVTSYAGLLTADKKCESHLFFWFFPAQQGDWKKAPMIFWQQGGPGTTSIFGLINEFGPFGYSTDSGLTNRTLSWNVKNNLLIIDNPAGVGFSLTKKNCYPTNLENVGKLLYAGVAEFYRLFPQLISNSLIIAGESYAGKYLPLLAYNIHQNNALGKNVINLTAIVMISSYADPLTQNPTSALYYNLGFIDDAQKFQFVSYESLCASSIESKSWEKADEFCNPLSGRLFDAFLSVDNIYNFKPGTKFPEYDWLDFIESASTRKALHVGKLLFTNENNKVLRKLNDYQYQSVKPYVEQMLEFYPFIFVNGQNDLICPYVLAVQFLRSLNWTKQTVYLNSNRTQWCGDNESLVGYFKGRHNLYDVLLRDSGHYIPRDQPQLSFDLINSITFGSPCCPLQDLFNCDNL